MSKKQDKLFVKKIDATDFIFDKSVAEVFGDMLERSVPFYHEIQRMMVELAAAHVQPNSVIYDLGCSHGNTVFLLADAVKEKTVKIVGIDSSKEMIRVAKIRKHDFKNAKNISFLCGNMIECLDMKDASVVILSLTLQFVRPAERLGLVRNIQKALKPGGALILLEKNIIHDSHLNRLFIDLYYEFKKRNGYSEIEISKKRTALENILVPYSIEENYNLLRFAGFNEVASFFQWYNFSGLLAVKKRKTRV